MLRTLEFFETRKRTEPDWIIPGWLKRKNTGFILGQPKRACKSWLLLNMGWQLSEGQPLWGIAKARGEYVFQTPRPLRVVYFTQEDTEDDVHDRVNLLLAAGQRPNSNFYIVSKDLKLSLDEAGRPLILSHLNLAIQDGPIDLVLFDPMRRMHSGKENDSEVIASLWRTLDIIHDRYNCSTMFSHHVVKPPRDSASTYDPTSPYAARGSGDIYGGGDAFINVIPRNAHGKANNSRLLDLHFETKRGKALAPVQLKMDFETGLVHFEGFLEGRGSGKVSKKTSDILDDWAGL